VTQTIDADAIIKEVEENSEYDTGIYLRVPGNHIPLSLKDLTLWNWTKLFMLHIVPAKEKIIKGENYGKQ